MIKYDLVTSVGFIADNTSSSGSTDKSGTSSPGSKPNCTHVRSVVCTDTVGVCERVRRRREKERVGGGREREYRVLAHVMGREQTNKVTSK